MMKSLAFGLLLMLDGAAGDWVQQERDVRPWNPEHSMWLLEAEGVPADHEVTLTVAVKVDDERRAMLEKTFWEVSDPKHEKYGQHLTIPDITKLLSVPQQRVDAVGKYFKEAGATSVVEAPNRDMISVKMPAAAAEKALKTRLGFFTHSERSGRRIVRASTIYHLPEEIDSHVELVGELLQFPRLRLKTLKNLQSGAGSWPNACDAPSCKGFVTPDVLAERYKFPKPSNSSNVASGNSMAVAEFQGQYFEHSDLKKFGQSCHRDVTVDKVIGGDEEQAGVEAELDIEYIKAVAPQVPLTVIYNSDYSLLSWANQISSLQDTPLVHSVSYGNDEIQQSSRQYMLTCNTAFMKAGARGISILFASGDQGVCGRSGCGLLSHARFHPDFPAGSPYVTAVGGTDFAGSSIGDEMAWVDGGGGFSDNFDIPDFQKSAVAAYKASPDADLPPQKLWNNTGRGYPDIAALGGQKAPYCVTTSGMFEGVAGTSASSPVAAGIFALLNGLRVSQNKAPLGFLNPFIYQNPSAFQDVTSGTNGGGKKYGFKAVKGWDASTGMGTPNYEALSKVVMESVAHDKTIAFKFVSQELSAPMTLTTSNPIAPNPTEATIYIGLDMELLKFRTDTHVLVEMPTLNLTSHTDTSYILDADTKRMTSFSLVNNTGPAPKHSKTCEYYDLPALHDAASIKTCIVDVESKIQSPGMEGGLAKYTVSHTSSLPIPGGGSVTKTIAFYADESNVMKKLVMDQEISTTAPATKTTVHEEATDMDSKSVAPSPERFIVPEEWGDCTKGNVPKSPDTLPPLVHSFLHCVGLVSLQKSVASDALVV